MRSWSSSEPPIRPESLDRYLPFICSAVAILLYLSSVQFKFVWDDDLQIVNNPLIRSWSYLPWLFKTDVWRFTNPNVVGNYWRPLFTTWLLLNYKLFGFNPIGWHALAVVLHAATTFLTYRTARRLGADVFVAGAAALLFAVHPAHVETVAWVSGSTDSLMALFFLAALLWFIRGWETESNGKWVWFALSAASYGCALLSKETGIVMPGMALGYAVLHRRNKSTAELLRQGLLSMSLFTVVLAGYWIGRTHALFGISHSRFQITIGELMMTWPSLAWFYLKHLTWPGRMGLFYEEFPVLHPTFTRFWLPLLIMSVVLLAIFVAWMKTRERLIPAAMLLLVLPMIPAFVFPALLPTDFAHDRYLYLPSVGFTILIALLIKGVAAWFTRARFYRMTAIATIVVAFSVLTLSEMVCWANNLLLFRRATQVAPSNMVGFNGLAAALIHVDRVQDAMYVFEQVVKRDPNNWVALYNLGLDRFNKGDYQAAEQLLTKATHAYNLEGDSYAMLAESQLHLKEFSASEQSIRRAIAVKPYKPGYRTVLARALEAQGRNVEAMDAAKSELQLNPGDRPAAEMIQRLSSVSK